MSINGIPGQPAGLRGLQEAVRPRVEERAGERIGERQAPTPTPGATAVPSAIAPTRAQPSLPAEPPPGTDPELWSILSAEERVHFAKVGAMGPLTYGRISSQIQAPSPAPRGGRLNVTG